MDKLFMSLKFQVFVSFISLIMFMISWLVLNNQELMIVCGFVAIYAKLESLSIKLRRDN